MADVLTSVRLPDDTLRSLRQIAAANDTSIAEEIRRATTTYVADVLASPDFADRLREQLARNNAQIEELLARANQTKRELAED